MFQRVIPDIGEMMPDRFEDRRNISRHILPTASNLLGLCFVLFGMIRLYAFSEGTLLDEMTACTMILFLASCIFSYASIRAKSNSERYEKIADTLFLAGLIIMTIIALVVGFEVIR